MFIKAFTDIYKPDKKFEDTLEEAYPLKKPALRRNRNGQVTESGEKTASGAYASKNFTNKLKELEQKDFDAELKAYKKKKEHSDADFDFDDQALSPELPDNLAPGESISTGAVEYESIEISKDEVPTQRPLPSAWSAIHPARGDSHHELMNPQDPDSEDSFLESREAQYPTCGNSHHELVNPQEQGPPDSFRASIMAPDSTPDPTITPTHVASHHELRNLQDSSATLPPPLPQLQSESENDGLAMSSDIYSDQNLHFNADVAPILGLSGESHFRHLGISHKPLATGLDSTDSLSLTADPPNLSSSLPSVSSGSVLGHEFFGSHSPHQISKLDTSAEDIFASFGVPITESSKKAELCPGCGTQREGKNPVCHSCGAHFRDEI